MSSVSFYVITCVRPSENEKHILNKWLPFNCLIQALFLVITYTCKGLFLVRKARILDQAGTQKLYVLNESL